MHPADITALLRKSGSSQSRVAQDEDVSRSMVCAVINGRRTSARIKRAISKATGTAAEKLWPGCKKSPSPTRRKARRSSPAAVAAGAF